MDAEGYSRHIVERGIEIWRELGSNGVFEDPAVFRNFFEQSSLFF